MMWNTAMSVVQELQVATYHTNVGKTRRVGEI